MSGKWFAKAKAVKLMPKVEGLLDGPLNAFCELFEDEYRIYRTAGILKRQVFALGLARELDEAFDNLVKEKNVMSLDDSNTICAVSLTVAILLSFMKDRCQVRPLPLG